MFGVGFTVNDVTLHKQGELERERLLARAESAQRAADAANHMKDDFLITLSHELRSPLQGILGWARLLRGDQLDAKRAAEALDTIERIVRQQAELLNGLFDVSRIMAGKLEVERRCLDLSELVREAFEDKQFSAKTHGITMSCDAVAAVPVLADAERVHQILANLLGNAIKFTPVGGRVEVRCTTEAGEGVVSVRDSGEGVSSEFLPHLFDRFAQADRSKARRHGGLGLGLAIVRHLVDLHEGSVAAESPGPGRGTTMTVRLPLTPAVAEPAIAAIPPSVPKADPRQALCGLHVLLVDDDADVRESLAILLEMRAARVTVAASAGMALDAFVRTPPDVVVTDLGLPGEDGFALLQRLRQHQTGADVPVIAFSGYASASERTRCLEAGFATHLTKPLDPAILVEALAAVAAPGPGAA